MPSQEHNNACWARAKYSATGHSDPWSNVWSVDEGLRQEADVIILHDYFLLSKEANFPLTNRVASSQKRE
eukprot:8575818-Pyramimonas_sp.AAC.1